MQFNVVTAAVRDEECGTAPAAVQPRGWTDISFVLPLILTGAGGIFGLAAGMTVRCAARHLPLLALHTIRCQIWRSLLPNLDL